jgi:hypothetical protein
MSDDTGGNLSRKELELELKRRVAAMSEAECRERLAEFSRRAKLGDYDWEYSELVLIRNRLPDEVAANKKADKARVRRASRRRYG